jgi:hypothetical protein
MRQHSAGHSWYTMASNSDNPYRAPQHTAPASVRWSQYGPALVWALPIIMLGSAITAHLGVQTYSVTATLVPSAISFAIAMCLVIRDSQGSRRYLAGVCIFAGSITSFVASSLYLDNIGWFPRFAAESDLAVAAAIGATCFAASVAVPCFRLRFTIAAASAIGAFVTFFITAFAALVILDNSRVTPFLLYIMFLCSACFQAIVIITASVVTSLLSPHVRSAPQTAV